MKKNLVKLMSVILLVAMCFSLMSVCASADFIITGGEKPDSASQTFEPEYEAEEEESELPADAEDASAKSEDEDVEETEEAEEIDTEPAEARELPEGWFDFAAEDGIATEYGDIYCEFYNSILNNLDTLTEGDVKAFTMLFGKSPIDAAGYGVSAMSENTENPEIIDGDEPGLFVVNYNYYHGILDAIKAAKAGSHVLWARETMVFTDETYSMSIDLQGCELRFYCNPAIAVNEGTLTIYNGTIVTDPREMIRKVHEDDMAALFVTGSNSFLKLFNVTVKTADVVYDDEVTVASAGPALIAADGASVVIDGKSRLATYDTNGDCAAIEVESGASVTLYGAAKSSFGNAVLVDGGTLITKAGSSASSTYDAAIKVTGESSAIINGGVVSGPMAVYIDGGELHVNGGSVKSTYSSKNVSKYINECATEKCDGSAVVAVGDTEDPQITVNGGNIVAANTKSRSISGYVSDELDKRIDDSKIHVVLPKDGSGVDATTRKIYADQEAVAQVKDADGTHNFMSLEEAVAYASAGDTITLLDNVIVDGTITLDKPVTLDGNRKTIWCSEDFEGPSILQMTSPLNSYTIKGVTLNGKTKSTGETKVETGIEIKEASAVLDGVNIENCTEQSIYASDAHVCINFVETDRLTPLGISNSASEITIKDCVINNDTIIDSTDGLFINGGIFWCGKVKAGEESSNAAYKLLHDTLKLRISNYKSKDNFNYYKVNAEVCTIKYSKDTCVFSMDETTDNFARLLWYITFAGKDIDNHEVLEMRFTGSDGETYTISDTDFDTYVGKSSPTSAKQYIYIYPEKMAEFASDNGMGPGKYIVEAMFEACGWQTCDTPLYIIPYMPYISDDHANAVTTYGKGSTMNLTVVIEDEPQRVGINKAATIAGTEWFNDKQAYFTGDGYNYLITSGELNSLAQGQYYIIVKYDDDFAVSLPLTIGPDTGVHLYNAGNASHTAGGANSLSFTSTDPIKAVYIGLNKVLLDPSYYTLSNNGTTLTISSSYLNKLSVGSYTVFVDTARGQASGTFYIVDAQTAGVSAQTGDTANLAIWTVLLALSSVAIVVILLPRFRRNKG